MIGQAVRYGAVGVLSVGMYVAGVWVLATHQNVNRNAAVFIAFALATTFNYLANRYWSFLGSVPHRQAVARYIVLVVAGLIWNELGVELMCSCLPLMAAVSVASLFGRLCRFSACVPGFSAIPSRHNP